MNSGETYAAIMQEQTKRALWGIHNVLHCIPDLYWDKEYCNIPLWKHVYHTLHSLDRWFINPAQYEEPSFHKKDLNNLNARTEAALTKQQMLAYYGEVEGKILTYLSGLTEDMLREKPENCEHSRFALILGQHRHLQYHIGILAGFIIAGEGKWPRIIGLEEVFPQENCSMYF